MNTTIKLLLVSCALAISGGSGAFAAAAADDGTIAAAADDGTIAVAPTTPSEGSNAAKNRDGKRGQGMAEQRLEQLDKTLQLTADQKQQIKEIWAKEAAAAKGGEGKDRRAALMRSRDEVRAVLTPAQQEKFDHMKPEGRGPGAKVRKAK
jgi:Spy/CpxP family protein refolding chaperone